MMLIALEENTSGLLLERLRRLRLKTHTTRARRDDCDPVGDGRRRANQACERPQSAERVARKYDGQTSSLHTDQQDTWPAEMGWAALDGCACAPRVGAPPSQARTGIYESLLRRGRMHHGVVRWGWHHALRRLNPLISLDCRCIIRDYGFFHRIPCTPEKPRHHRHAGWFHG